MADFKKSVNCVFEGAYLGTTPVTRFDTGAQVLARDGSPLMQVLIRTGEGVREQVERITMREEDIPADLPVETPVRVHGSVSVTHKNERVYVSPWGNRMGIDASQGAKARSVLEQARVVASGAPTPAASNGRAA
jgi:hypothetical protein